MKINDHHYEFNVTNEKQMRRRVREMVELTLADGSKTFTVTLNHPATSKQVTMNLLKEDDSVKFLLMDKVAYNQREVYPVVKHVLQLQLQMQS